MFVEQLDERLAHWDTWLGHASDRVLEMETRHPLYFGAGSLRYKGQTEPLDTAAAEAVNHVFLLLDRAQELARQARALRGAGGPLSSDPVQGGLELLSTETVRIETGENEARRRIFLPLQEAYEGSANELLEHLDAMYGRAMERLDTLHEAVDSTEALISEIATNHDTAQQACVRRREMGLDADLLIHALVVATEGLDQAEDTAPLDPVGAAGPLGQILTRVRDVAGRATAGNDIMGQLRGPVRELGKGLRDTVARMRTEGFRMDEPGLAPESRLNDRADDAIRIAPLLDHGDLQGARTLLDTIATDLQHLSAQLSTTESAREGIPNAVQRALATRDRLEGLVPNAREILDTLTSDHDPATFAVESDNLEEFAAMLGGLEKWRRKVTAAHAAQRYLEAAREVRGCEAFLTLGQELLDAIDHVQSSLNGAREHAKAAWHGIAGLRDGVQTELNRNDARPGTSGRKQVEELTAQTDPIAGIIARQKPHWPNLSNTLDTLHDEWEVLEQQLAGWRRDFTKAHQIISTTRGRLHQLEALVTTERRDRPHVAAALEAALGDMAQWDEAVADTSLTGSELMDRAEGFQQRAVWAEAVWNREVQAITDAQTEAAAAIRRFTSLRRTSFGWSVSARISHLNTLERELEQHRAAARYEDVVHTARRLREGCAQERKRCERQVRQRRDTQRRKDARAAAAAAAARRTSSSSFSSSGSSSSGAFSSSSSSSGGGSFSSSSGGSSFGSSNSGGSSW
jgi:chromosome segregation ATPase